MPLLRPESLTLTRAAAKEIIIINNRCIVISMHKIGVATKGRFRGEARGALASYADVLRLVTRSSPRGEERVTSLRTAWEARGAPTPPFFLVFVKCFCN